MHDLIAAAVVLLSAAVAATRHLSRKSSSQQLKQLQALLQREQEKRAADRAGRIRAERQLKQLRLEQLQSAVTGPDGLTNQADTNSGADAVFETPADNTGSGCCNSHANASNSQANAVASPSVFPVSPIGVLRSCFTNRAGTPRQPQLVPAACAMLKLAPDIPPACLSGLQQFSHCWVLYVFHENTDMGKLVAARSTSSNQRQQAQMAGVKSSTRVPRLNGAKMGVLATRTPHRPVPIGLSTARIVEVDAAAGVLVLGGADIVDGAPVLDIKPYIPFCDALADAAAPTWVTNKADQEPLALGGVVIDSDAAQQLTWAWQRNRRQSMYKTAEGFISLISQALARDIRSLHQRTNVLQVQAQQQVQTCQTASSTQQPARSSSSGSQQGAGNHSSKQPTGSRSSSQQQLSSSFADRPHKSAAIKRYYVTLDNVRIGYDIDSSTGKVFVRTANPAVKALDHR